MADISIGNSLTGLIYFIILTTIYFGFKAFYKSPKIIMIMTIIYFLTLLIGEFFINVSVSNDLCGSQQYGTAAIVTFIPWIFIFGFLKVLLTIFPGWLSPFSNTFGYLVTKLFGISEVLNNILSTKFDNKDVPENMKIAAEALEHIYNDKSLLINEITQENFDTFWKRMSDSGFFKKNADEFKENLRYFVKMKDTVSEFIWFILSGGLVTSVSYNYIVNSECKKSADKMKENVSETEAQADLTAKNNNQPRVYTSTE